MWRAEQELQKLYRGGPTEVLFIRHFFSMSNWLESFVTTETTAHLILDPDISPYGVLQASDIVYNPRYTEIGEWIMQHRDATGRIHFDVSRLRRTWETALLIVAFLNQRYNETLAVVFHIYNSLDEIGSGRDNTPDNFPSQQKKLEEWCASYESGFVWSRCAESTENILEFDYLKNILHELSMPKYMFSQDAASKSNIIVGHSKWYSRATTSIPDVEIKYPGQKKVKYAPRSDASRIDNFVNVFQANLFQSCGVTYANRWIPRGRCCTKTKYDLVKGQRKDKPGSGQISSMNSTPIRGKY
tara:strand:+ start:1191 stop:2090 length:900 start_codon:yes stop_codon:yes gene_type:complete